MTIIKPNRTHRATALLFTASIMALFVVAAWSIALYNGSVNMTHEISAKEREHKALLTKNAELKNAFYAITDAKNLRRVAEASGLRPIASPEYIEESRVPTLAAR